MKADILTFYVGVLAMLFSVLWLVGVAIGKSCLLGAERDADRYWRRSTRLALGGAAIGLLFAALPVWWNVR